jgi:hypothetical protein
MFLLVRFQLGYLGLQVLTVKEQLSVVLYRRRLLLPGRGCLRHRRHFFTEESQTVVCAMVAVSPGKVMIQ